jgi:hypothetical protein
MRTFKRSIRLADERELKIRQVMISRAPGNGDRRLDYQATDVMHWVVTFKSIAGNAINSLHRFAVPWQVRKVNS